MSFEKRSPKFWQLENKNKHLTRDVLIYKLINNFDIKKMFYVYNKQINSNQTNRVNKDKDEIYSVNILLYYYVSMDTLTPL